MCENSINRSMHAAVPFLALTDCYRTLENTQHHDDQKTQHTVAGGSCGHVSSRDLSLSSVPFIMWSWREVGSPAKTIKTWPSTFTDSTSQRSNQDAHGNFRGTAEIQSVGGKTCCQGNHLLWTPQVWPLWMNTKKEVLVESKPSSILIYISPQIM